MYPHPHPWRTRLPCPETDLRALARLLRGPRIPVERVLADPGATGPRAENCDTFELMTTR